MNHPKPERVSAAVAIDRDAPPIQAFLGPSAGPRAVFDIDGRLIVANEAYCQAMGRHLEQMRGEHFWEFIDPESLPATLEALDQLSYRGDVADFVNCYRKPDGEAVWLRWNCPQAGVDGLIFATAEVIDDPR